MNTAGAFGAALDHFQRLLRWVYPGLLLWIVLPLVTGPAEVNRYTGFYVDVPWGAHLGIIVASGFLIYLIERYLIHEVFLGTVLFWLNVGTAASFRRGGSRWWYPLPDGRFLWVRFGRRPRDFADRGEGAEDRFSGYMMARMASVHALGSSWLIGIGAYVVGLVVFDDSAFQNWQWSWHVIYVGVMVWAILGWTWHVIIAARAEQSHYSDRGEGL